jgi:hypothetical protein
MNTFGARFAETLKRLFSSAKVLTAVAGLIVTFAAKRGIILSPDDVQTVLLIFLTLIGAQGLTDIGVRKAEVEAAAPPKPPETVQTQTVNVESPEKEVKRY